MKQKTGARLGIILSARLRGFGGQALHHFRDLRRAH